MIINNNELKFAEKVILVDASYINKVRRKLDRRRREEQEQDSRAKDNSPVRETQEAMKEMSA